MGKRLKIIEGIILSLSHFGLKRYLALWEILEEFLQLFRKSQDVSLNKPTIFDKIIYSIASGLIDLGYNANCIETYNNLNLFSKLEFFSVLDKDSKVAFTISFVKI